MKSHFRAIILGIIVSIVMTSPATAVSAKSFKNCAALNKVHPGGVSKSGAVDMTKKNGKFVPAKPKKVPTVDDALYAENPKLDRDKDGIACEK